MSHEQRCAPLGPVGRLCGLASGVFDLLHEDDDTAAMCCDRQQRGVPDLWILRGPVSGLPSPYGAAAVERLSATPDVQAEGTAPSIARAGPFPRVDAPLRQAGILQGK